MRFRSATFLAIFILVGSVFAQEKRSTHLNPAYNLWLIRSQTLTEELLKDATVLTPSERALLWAKLAQLWWRHDPEKARSWMRKAVDSVEDVPNRENPDERYRRLTTARSLLRMVAPMDQELDKRLIALLNKDAVATDRAASAEALFEAAIAIVNQDPQRAAEMGALALQMGRPPAISYLMLALRRKNSELGDALFAETLKVAEQSSDGELLMSLTHVAFPAETQMGGNFSGLPDEVRKRLLRVDVAYLQANPINSESRNSACTAVISFIAPVVAQFDRLLPQQSAFVRQRINQCQSISPLAQQRLDDSLREVPLRTVDDFLKAADDAKDLKVRTVYQFRAATLAGEKKDYARALKILDDMSKEARDFTGGTWEARRWEWAALSAVDYFLKGDIYQMRLVMKAVPGELEPQTKIAFVAYLPDKRNKETDPTQEFLNDARTGLGRSGLSDLEKCSWYFGLLEFTVKYQPADAIAVLKESVATLNRSDKSRLDGEKESHLNLLKTISPNLPATLLEMDEQEVKEAISAISAPNTRARLRLDLLGTCFGRLGGTEGQ